LAWSGRLLCLVPAFLVRPWSPGAP
jgi:hypothetical protein